MSRQADTRDQDETGAPAAPALAALLEEMIGGYAFNADSVVGEFTGCRPEDYAPIIDQIAAWQSRFQALTGLLLPERTLDEWSAWWKETGHVT